MRLGMDDKTGTQGGQAVVQAQLDALLHAEPDTPISALWLQDWVGTQKVPWGEGMIWNWEANPQQYPEWAAFIAQWRSRGVRMMVYVLTIIAGIVTSEIDSLFLSPPTPFPFPSPFCGQVPQSHVAQRVGHPGLASLLL